MVVAVSSGQDRMYHVQHIEFLHCFEDLYFWAEVRALNGSDVTPVKSPFLLRLHSSS